MSYTKEEFIKVIGPMAQKDAKASGILASLTLAQACLESRYGNSQLTVKANNLFGIKGVYNGEFITISTTEEDKNGNKYTELAQFKKYADWQESIQDHSSLFNRASRYANLRGETDYKVACKNVQADGYATDSHYAEKLIDLIEENNLTQYDCDMSTLATYMLAIKIGDTTKQVNSVIVEGSNYVKLQDLNQPVLKVGYTDKPTIDVSTQLIDVRENGVVKQVDAINIAGHNYVKLQDLNDNNIKIGYGIMPTIEVYASQLTNKTVEQEVPGALKQEGEDK